MKYIAKELREVINQMNPKPLFFADNFNDVSQSISEIGFDKTKTTYPLIFLETSNIENKNNEQLNVASEVSIDIYFVVDTNKEYTTEQSIDESFIKVLEPLISKFFFAMYRSGKFVFDETRYLENYYSIINETTEMYKKTFINDIVDALKININLKIRK